MSDKDLNYGVYFIYSGEKQTSPVKIGVTTDLERRIAELQTGNPYQLNCKALIPCSDKTQAYNLESFFHKQFKKNRMMGEWFKLYHFDMKKLLNRFNGRESEPIAKQSFNIVKITNDLNRKLEKENGELKLQVSRLEDLLK